MSGYQGDYKASSVVDIFFTTNSAVGAAVAPLSAFEAADVVIYKNHSATQRTSTAGITMTSPFDSIVGLHQLSIDTSDNTDAGFWAAGNDYTCVLSPDTETVDGQVIAAVIGIFSIENRVVNWAKVTSQATSVNLSGTTIKEVTDVETSLAAIASTLSTIAGYIDTEVAAIKAKTDNLPPDPADASDIAASFASLASTLATIAGYIDTEVAAIKAKTDLIPGSPAAVGSAMTLASNSVTAAALAADAVAEIANGLLDLTDGVETGLVLRNALRDIFAACAGKASGMATSTGKFRNFADDKDRITATTDADGNRTAITYDHS